VDVNSSVMMRTDNDVLVTIAVIGDAPNFRESIYVVGDTGAVYLEGGKVYHKVSPWEEMREISDEPAPWFGKAFDRDSNFVGCILDGDENESPSEGALRVAALTEAILASAKAGGEGIKVTWPEI